jgi:predicted PurR-regulated permease PerM
VEKQPIVDKFFKLSLGLFATCGTLWMFFVAGSYLIHIVALCGFTLLFTYLLLAPVNLLEDLLQKGGGIIANRLKASFLLQKLPALLPRAISIILVYFLFVMTMFVVSVKVLPIAYDQLSQFSNVFSRYIHWILNLRVTQDYFHQEVRSLANQGVVTLPKEDTQNIPVTMKPEQVRLSPSEKEVIRKNVFSTSNRIDRFVREHIGKAFNSLVTLIGTTLAGFVYTLTSMVLVFYLLLDGPRLKGDFIKMLPAENQHSANFLLSNLHEVMFGYIKGHVILGAISGVFLVTVNSLIGIPYAFFLGLFFAVCQVIPVVGPWLGVLPYLLVLDHMTPGQLFMSLGALACFQLIKDLWVAPKILGHVMGLHPVIVILSLLICAKVAGLVGILFAIPLASTVNVFIRFFQEQGDILFE